MKAKDIEKEIRAQGDPVRARGSTRYFKTGKGEYGEGDVFVGLTVPAQRIIAKQHKDISLSEVQTLLQNKIHEVRFVALEILVFKYESGTDQEKIVKFYLKNTKHINNWDLVDTSASYILGNWLLAHDRAILYTLVRSKNIWERRIAIVATNALIQHGELRDTLALAELLIHDSHDLMHKATGWMLREVGKKSQPVLETFLKKHAPTMPRTMLRYAIERFPETKRKAYLSIPRKI